MRGLRFVVMPQSYHPFALGQGLGDVTCLTLVCPDSHMCTHVGMMTPFHTIGRASLAP